MSMPGVSAVFFAKKEILMKSKSKTKTVWKILAVIAVFLIIMR